MDVNSIFIMKLHSFFQGILLMLLPAAFLWIFLPYYVKLFIQTYHNPQRSFHKWSKLTVLKVISKVISKVKANIKLIIHYCLALLVLICSILLILAQSPNQLSAYNSSSVPVYTDFDESLTYFTLVSLVAAWVLDMLAVMLHHKAGHITSKIQVRNCQ